MITQGYTTYWASPSMFCLCVYGYHLLLRRALIFVLSDCRRTLTMLDQKEQQALRYASSYSSDYSLK